MEKKLNIRRTLTVLLSTTSFVYMALNLAEAQAADVLPPANTWTGWHLGAGVGYGMANHELDLDLAGFGLAAKLSGIGAEGGLATVEAGYDYQFNDKWLIGGQLDYTYSNIATELGVTLGGFNGDYVLQAEHAISALLRVGHLVNDTTLLYSIGGYTRTSWSGEPNLPGLVTDSYSYKTDGFTLGGGIENVIADNMTVKFEYRYTMNEDKEILNLGAFGSLSENANQHTARMVLSYRPGVAAATMDGSEEQWTGLRAGVGAGYSMINHELALDVPRLANATFSGIGGEGFLGGVELGADMLAAQRFVVGAQVGYTYSEASTDLDVSLGGGSLNYELEATHSFDVLGRAGILTGPDVLWYGLAGWTRTTFNGELSSPFFSDSYKYKLDGLTVGAGMEVMLTDNLSWKTEYRYTDFEKVNIVDVGFASLDANSNVQSVRTVMSWHF